MPKNRFLGKTVIVIFSIGLLAFVGYRYNAKHTGYEEVGFNNQQYHVFAVNFKTDSIVLGWKDQNGNLISSLKGFDNLLNGRTLMLTNAGMFHPDYTPVGLYIENGKKLIPVDTTSAKGNFYLKPNGIFGVNRAGFQVLTTELYLMENPVFEYATQSGPMLVIDGAIHSGFSPTSKNKQIRSGIGVNANGDAVVVLSKQPVTFYEFASLFLYQLNCKNALYLDGAISKMQCKAADLEGDGRFGCMLAVLKK